MNKPKYTSRQLRESKIHWRGTLNSAEKIRARRTRCNPKTCNKNKKNTLEKTSANIGTRNANVINTYNSRSWVNSL